MKISLKDKTVRVAAIIAFFLIFIVVLHLTVGRWILVENLQTDQIKSEEVQRELKKKQDLIKAHPNPRQKIEEIKQQIEELKKKAVSERELPRIIQQLTKKSSELKIEIISIKPIKEVPFDERPLPKGVSKAYMEVVLKVPYKVLGDYLKALEEMPIIFTIESLTLEKFEALEEEEVSTAEQPLGKLIATLLISSYTIWQI